MWPRWARAHPQIKKKNSRYCHNPIFTHGIFSGVGTQNGTARAEPAWPDEASPWQILPWRRSGTHFPRFDQVWLGLTEVWPRFDQAISNPTRTHRAQKPSKCNPGNISKNLESFDQIRPSLTKVDQGLTGPLTRPKTESNWLPLDHSEEHVQSFNSILYGSKTDKKWGSYGQNCEKTVQHLAKFC